MNEFLDVRGVSKRFGGVQAVDNVSLTMAKGTTLGIIGPNGAGKTTFLNLINGTHKVDSGKILLDGRDITGCSPATACYRGIGRTYQIPQPFKDMTVMENVRLGRLYGQQSQKWISMKRARDEAYAILNRVGLGDKSDWLAGKLNLLQLKRLELARALSVDPKLLLLDEIGAGLVKDEIAQLIELMKSIRADGLSIIVIEHVMEFIVNISDRVVVMEWGKKIADDIPERVMADERVKNVYLGEKGDACGDKASKPVAKPIAKTEASDVKTAAGVDESSSSSPLLSLKDVNVSYGSFQALFGVSMEIRQGEIVALIGANGSGKTTTARTIGGMLRPTQGTVEFDGKPFTKLRADQTVNMGIAHCMEGRKIFPDFTVMENLKIGAYTDRASDSASETLEWVLKLFPVLARRSDQFGQTLSGGEQQMLAIGRALMANPRLLLLDEVSLGLAPKVIDELFEAICQINKKGVSILLVEQSIYRSLAIADRAYIMERGRISLSGSAADLISNESVEKSYFGLG